MDVTISGRNVDVSQDVKDAVRSKIGSLDRFVPGLDRAAVVFREEKNPRIAERDQLEATLEAWIDAPLGRRPPPDPRTEPRLRLPR